jgi:hypothetical protein
MQSSQKFAGTYSDKREGEQSVTVSLSIAQATGSTPGMAVTNFTFGSQDIHAAYARLQDIEPEDLSFKLYPTDLVEHSKQGVSKMAFRAVFQDINELADARTPTCETWTYLDKLQVYGAAIYEFVFKTTGDSVFGVEIRALGLQLEKE